MTAEGMSRAAILSFKNSYLSLVRAAAWRRSSRHRNSGCRVNLPIGLPRTRPTKRRRRPTRIPTGTVPRRRLRAESSLAGPRRRRATHVSATARHPPPGSTRPTLESVKQVSGATGMIAEADIAPATDVPALADLPDTQVPACVVAQAVCAVGRGGREREPNRGAPASPSSKGTRRGLARRRALASLGVCRLRATRPGDRGWD